MEQSFQAIIRQLPGDTEIPGLIEDITLVGLKNGLGFTSIDLQAEIRYEFYIEKPIKIIVNGSYHDLGSFVSDVADLSRIVTLHDFTILPVRGNSRNQVAC
jgi:type IV pilus assembly protein PilO